MRVLVVEDDDLIREILCQLLEEEGYAVNQAEDGENGLHAILDHKEPQVVLLDLLLPRLSGEEVLTAALEYKYADQSRINAEFILITAVSDLFKSPTLAGLIQKHKVMTLTKPFAVETLLAFVKQAVARAAAHVA